MVCAGARPSLREASCCRVEVVNGGIGMALGRLRLDLGDAEGRELQVAAEGFRLRARADVEARDLAAVGADEPRLEDAAVLRRQRRDERPVFARDERLDLELAVADEAQRHRLHAAGRARAGELAPQDRRQREADEVVERAARQVGVDERLVDLARAGAARSAPRPW